MYRDDRWEKGMYADDLVKFRCSSCGDEFIAGRTAVEKANTKGHQVHMTMYMNQATYNDLIIALKNR